MALPGFLQKLKRNFQGVVAQVNPFDRGATYKSVVSPITRITSPSNNIRPPAPVTVTRPNRPQASLATRVFAQINPFDRGATFKSPVTAPPKVTPIKLANPNKTGINPLGLKLLGTVKNAVIGGVKPFAQDVATAITAPYAEHVANQEADRARKELYIPNASPAYKAWVEAYANSVKTNLLNQHLATAGITSTTPTSTVIRKVGGAAAETAANIALAGRLPGITNAATKTALAREALGYGGLSSAANVASTAQEDNPTPIDYLKSGAIGFGTGTALPVAGATIPLAAKGAIKIAKGTPGAVNKVAEIGVPRASIEDQRVLESYSNYLSGAEQPKPGEINALVTKARQVGQKHGIDLVTGAPEDRLNRTNSILDQIGKQRTAITQGGYIGGRQATGFNEANLHGKTFAGPDFKKRFEADDHAATVTAPTTQVSKLSDVLDHPTLYQDYPQLANVEVVKFAPKNGKLYGGYNKDLNTIYVNEKILKNPDLLKSTLLHEAQHAIQNIEGFAQGTTSKAVGVTGYKLNPGEQEAMAVGNRADLTPEQRATTPLGIGPPVISDIRPAPVRFAASEVPAPPVEPTGQPRGFTESVRTSPEVSKDVRGQVKGEYNPLSNATLVANSQGLIQGDVNQATEQVNAALNKPSGMLSAQDVSNGIALAKHYDSLGTDVSHEQAASLYDRLAEHLTAAGQEVQAAALLARQTAAGIYYQARKLLKKNNVEITPELDKALQDKLQAIRVSDTASEQLDQLGTQLDNTALGTPERTHALADYAAAKQAFLQRQHDIYDFQQEVASHLPAKRGKQLIDIWKGGLLSSPTTSAGNILSNTVESAQTALIRDPLAAALDATLSGIGKAGKALGIVSKGSKFGLRTKTLAGGYAKGAKIGIGKSGEYLKTGYDERNVQGKYNTADTTSQKIYPGTVFRALGAQDQPFWYANYQHNLLDQAKAAAINQGLKGEARQQFIDTFMLKPPNEADNLAQTAASRSVFSNDTALNDIVSAARNAKGGKYAGAVSFIVPFSRVPSAVATRILERSPGGAVLEIAKQIKNGSYDQRALVEALSDSAVGTAGTLLLGSALVKANAITLGYPTDPKERALWQAEGKQPYSIRIGNTWLSLNYMQPFGSLLAASAQYAQSRQDGQSQTQALEAAGAAAGKSVVGQSFLQGVSGVLNAIQDPTQSAETYINSTAGGIVPNIIKRAASATDPLQRQINSAMDALKAGIPGLRETLLPKVDTLGNKVPRGTSSVSTFLNPLKPSDVRSSALISEIDRLSNIKDAQGNALNVIPNKVAKTVSIDGVSTKLSPEQQTALQTAIGQGVQQLWNQTIASPAYKALNDADKAKMLSNIASDVTGVVTHQYASQNGLGQFAPGFTGKPTKPSAKQQALMQNGFDPKNYTPGAGAFSPDLSQPSRDLLTKVGAMTSSDRKKFLNDGKNNYNYQVARFENDVASHSLSPTQIYTKQLSLGKLSVTSNYSQDAQDLYGLSKAQLNAYMKSHQVPQETLNSLLSMDNELYQKGFISTPKFKYGLTGNGGVGTKAKTINVPLPNFGSFSIARVPSGKGRSGGSSNALGTFRSRVSKLGLSRTRPESASPIKIRV